MGRKPNWPPKLVRKPGSAEARCYHAGRWHTCGKWDVARGEATPAAKATHARLVAQWLADPGSAVRPAGEYLLATLLADWGESAEGPDTAVGRKRLRRAVALLGARVTIPAGDFTPAVLTAWRKEVGGSRGKVTVWAYTAPVLRAYQWAEDAGRVSEGLAARLWAAARRVSAGLPEVPRGPADPAAVVAVQATLDAARSQLAPLFRLHALTGARVTELLRLTAGDVRKAGVLRTRRGASLDLTAEGVWAADVREHKTAHSGKERVLVFGAKARRVLAGVMKGRGAGDRLFPVDSTETYRAAVVAACDLAGVPRFAPRQLRQMVADRVRDALTGEHAAAYLGHGPKGVTQRHYLTLALKKAAEAARAVG